MKELIVMVRKSYGRCLNDATFFDKFYDRFLATTPEVKEMFANTDFDKQKKLINKGVNMMIMYAGGDNVIANNVISRIRVSHNRENLNVSPGLYALWKKALIDTVAESDPGYTSETSEAWNEVLEVGIGHITAGYNDVS